MDFDQAAKRLEQEHRNIRAKNLEKRSIRSLLGTSDFKTQQIEEYRQKQLQQKRENDLREKRRIKILWDYIHHIEIERLGYVSLASVERNTSSAKSSLNQAQQTPFSERNTIVLKATSIYGQGDKVTLPPSVLSLLVQHDMVVNPMGLGQPLFFRLAIAREGYFFPASMQLTKMATDQLSLLDSKSSMGTKGQDDEDDDDTEISTMETSVDPYLSELSHQFISYTFATVIEFTEEEGCIGLPFSIARALLDATRCDSLRNHDGVFEQSSTMIEYTTTIDPSSSSTIQDPMYNEDSQTLASTTQSTNVSWEQQTPGHPAYGAFPIPSHPIVISLLTHLPLGKRCSLQPSQEAIEHGFHRLKDVKYVLEQSLIKTRATLSIGDVVYAWFRGTRYDLIVKEVEPHEFGVISCVNTDITVDIISEEEGKRDANESIEAKSSSTVDDGYRLGSNAYPTNSQSTSVDTRKPVSVSEKGEQTLLPSEPPSDGNNVVTIQIRGSNVVCKRRFNTSSTILRNLFDFARLENVIPGDVLVETQCRLVTRFPRRVFECLNDGDKTLIELGIGTNESQVMLLLERI